MNFEERKRLARKTDAAEAFDIMARELFDYANGCGWPTEKLLIEHLHEVAQEHYREPAEDDACEWSKESDDVWRSDCGLLWEFDNEDTPTANNMNYCPQCGKILEEAPECWEEAE